MIVNVYRRKQRYYSIVVYELYVDGVKKASLGTGDSKKFTLDSGGQTAEIRGVLDSYAPSFVFTLYAIFRGLPRSGKIKVKDVGKKQAQVYFVVSNRERVALDVIKIRIHWVYCLITGQERPQKVLLTQGDDKTFEEIREGQPLLYERRIPANSREKRLVLALNIIGAVWLVFGLYLFSQNSGNEAGSLGWAIVIAGVAHLIQLVRYIKTSKLSFHYEGMCWVCGWDVFIMLILVVVMKTVSPLVVGLCALFIIAFGYVFFKTKRVFKRSGKEF